MKKKIELVTNNEVSINFTKDCNENVSKHDHEYVEINVSDVKLVEKDYMDVLLYVRDKIHKNYKLLTHPLASNFLPDNTFYKSILIEESNELDFSSVTLIEDAIILAKEALRRRRTEAMSQKHILEDLKFVDFQVIKHSIERLFK